MVRISCELPHSALVLAPASGAPDPGHRGREVGLGRGAAWGRPTRAVAGAGLGVARDERRSVRRGQQPSDDLPEWRQQDIFIFSVVKNGLNQSAFTFTLFHL